MKSLYVLVVDKSWAKLYKADDPPVHLTLVYHQALFGGRAAGENVDGELATSLCRILRADRQSGKFGQLAMLASVDMLAALRLQFAGDWDDVVVGRIEDLPSRYTGKELSAHLCELLARRLPRLAEADANS